MPKASHNDRIVAVFEKIIGTLKILKLLGVSKFYDKENELFYQIMRTFHRLEMVIWSHPRWDF